MQALSQCCGGGRKKAAPEVPIEQKPKSEGTNVAAGAGHQSRSNEPNGAPVEKPPVAQSEDPPVSESAQAPATSNAGATEERNLWRKAFNQLSEKRQKTLKELGFDQSSGSAESDIDDLVTSVNAKQKQVEDNMWSASVGGKEIVFRQYTTDIVGWLTKAGDIAVQFAPPQAAVPWSVLKGLMNIAVIESEQMAALLEVTERVVRVISRGQVYESVYLRNEKAAIDDKLSKGLETALTKIYNSALDLLASSAELFKDNTVVRAFKSLYNQGSIASGLAGIDAQEELMLKDVQALEVRRSANADDSMIEMLEKLDAPIARMDVGIQHLLQSVDEAERMEMLEWISSVPFGKNHHNVKAQRTPGTGLWLLQDEQFRAWEKRTSSGLFWIQGSPGTGKTFLTSTVIDTLQDPLASEPKDEGFAFFYCDKNEPSRSKPLAILQSIVRQLSTTSKSPEATRTELHALYKKCRKQGSGFDLEQCKEQILASLEIYEKSTIVLDALDECDVDMRDEIIDVLNRFLVESKRPVKVFVSSRPSTDMEAQLERKPDTTIEATNNEGDIQKFLSAELDKLAKKAKILSTLKVDITKALLARSQGMFQWAALQTHQISKCRTAPAVWSRLENLPEDLEKAYDEAWSQIEELEEGDKILVTRAMLWVMAAEKPFTSEELLSAIRVNNSGEESLLADPVNAEDLLYLCNNLLAIDTQLNVWRFSHLSVAEYLQPKMAWHPAQIHLHAASASLKVFGAVYDEENADHTATAEALYTSHPFHIYLRHHWFRHCQRAQDGEAAALQPLLQTFLGSPNESSKQYRKWYELLGEDYDSMDPEQYGAYGAAGLDDAGGDLMDLYQSDPHAFEEFESELGPVDQAVFAMCHFSFSAVLSDWWESAEIDASSVNDRGHSLLTIAARVGCKPICEYLVGRSVDVNAQVEGKIYGSALAAAATHGHIGTLEYLVKAGAGVNLALQNGKYSTALIAAAGRKGNVEVVKCLVDNGANLNLNVKNGPFGTVLASAAHEDKLKVVQYLLDRGADVNQPTGNVDFATALHHAAAFGSPAVVSCLIKAGAEVNCIKPTGRYGTPLMAAAYWGRKDNVVCLVDAGADVNLKLEAEDEHRPDCLLSPLAVAQEEDRSEEGDAGLWMYLRVGAQEENQMEMREEMEKGAQEVAEYLEKHGATA